jgi:hypothetical protein
MTPGQNLVLKTRKGGTLVKIATITSGNTLGARYWTDGKCEAPMLPPNPLLRKHPATGELFWTSECEEVAEEDPWGEEYVNVPFAETPTLSDYQSVLESGLAGSPKKERYVRMAALLDPGDPNQRLMSAEVWRELGEFDKSLELLGFDFPQEFAKAVGLIRRLAEERNTKVQPLV